MNLGLNLYGSGIYGHLLPIPPRSGEGDDAHILIEATVDRRRVIHDGYCSEADEDVGEWEYNIKEIYKLYRVQQAYLQDNGYIDGDIIDSNYLQTLDSDYLGCQMGSNYCYYEGQARIKGAVLLHCQYCNEYMNDQHKYCPICSKCADDYYHKHCDHCDNYNNYEHKYCPKCNLCHYDNYHKHCGYYIRRDVKCDIIDRWHQHCKNRCGFITTSSRLAMENHMDQCPRNISNI